MNGYRVTIVYDKLIAVAVTGLLFAVVSSILVYIKSQIAPTNICERGNSGIMIYDFFVGHELAPRIGNFDFKWFSFRFTLHLWIILNLLFLTKAWETQHTLPPTLALVSLTQIYYLVDNLWFENNLLTMGDIMHEGFGYFALNGFFAFCPLMYSLQPRFLLENPKHQLPWYCLATILSLNILGYCLYRGSNSQKNEFRKNPKSPAVAHLKTIPTENGRGLLVSGWWGVCRKPNYLGDILLAFSWSLPCGFRHLMPYFYPMFITMMLLDREKTDSEYCKNKYKKSWDKYCEAVKYRIVPYVY
ncbi:hypothetical protein KUTeg_019452 [Tegillarca granosa]|uniref:Delta(14)-sterol reductase n=1 Tax=Tegillarca granosa TaxID=220873 RepID=A0ABQ9EGT7_TEGGR|nr:hypothetical protein KUTeg_019452 [Tegillarca granosa]